MEGGFRPKDLSEAKRVQARQDRVGRYHSQVCLFAHKFVCLFGWLVVSAVVGWLVEIL